jgi:phosphohistidine swiveling domain-containing protein
MKLLTTSIISVGLLATSALAQEKASVTAKPVIVSVSSGLPDGIGFMDKPSGYKKGALVTFFLQGESMTSIDKKSFKATGWKLEYGSRIRKGGKSGTLAIYNESFKGASNEIKIDATVDVLVGSKTATKKVTLKKDADPIKFPEFTAELSANGVKVIGKFNFIKSISIMRDGKEKESNGYSSSGDRKTFSLKGIKDGDEVSVTYWTDIVAKSVKLTK